MAAADISGGKEKLKALPPCVKRAARMDGPSEAYARGVKHSGLNLSASVLRQSPASRSASFQGAAVSEGYARAQQELMHSHIRAPGQSEGAGGYGV